MMKKNFTIMILAMLLMSIGTHAATLNNPTAADIRNCTDETLIVTGTLSAEAIAALQELSSNVKNVLLNQVTDYDASADFKFTSTTVQNIVLPKDLAEVKADWFTGCSSLGCAISYSSDGKTLRAHANKGGTLGAAFSTMTENSTISDIGGSWNQWGSYVEGSKIENAVLTGGKYTTSDLGSGWNSNVNSKTIKNVDLGDAAYDIGSAFSNNNSVLESIVLPKNTTTLNNAAFSKCKELKSVTLPTDLTAIPSDCFDECLKLEAIVVPSSVTTIGEKAFNSCTSLKTLVIGKSVNMIGNGAFTGCSSLETVEFEKGITNLNFASGVFERCTSLKHVVFPEGLQNIGDNMFNQCSNLESIRLPNSLQHIGEGAFKECTSLTYLTIPKNVKTIGCSAFEGSGIEDVYLMATTVNELPYICNSAFGSTPFTGNNSLAITIKPFADRLKLLIQRGVVTGCTVADVDSWLTAMNNNYDKDHMYDKMILSYLPSTEVEQIYRELVGSGNTIAMLHYPKVDESGNATELGMFIDGNPWKGTEGMLNEVGSFYSQGQHHEETGTRDWYRPIDVESPRLRDADHLSDAYGIGPDADGHYWPDTNHNDGKLRENYGNPDHEINANDVWKATATVTTDNNPFSGSYMGYSRYYWRNFLLQTGYSPNNDEVYSMWMDDTWYTMCFPFDLTDEQLEAAFQSNRFNIAEFSGAAIYPETKQNSKGKDVEVNNLVLCFTTIAYTWYKDKYDNYYYRTRDTDQNRTKHYWKAKRTWTQNSSGVWDWYLTTEDGTIMTDSNKGAEVTSTGTDKDIYESIDGILALAGHPYMIHPYRVEALDGTKTLCTLPKIVYKHDYNHRGSMDATKLKETMDAIKKLYDDEAVTRPLSTIKTGNKFTKSDDFFTDQNDGVTENHGKPYSPGRYDKLVDANKGKYTFKGTYKPAKGETLVTGEETQEVIPYGAYFLGVASGKKYPQFYRETSKNTSRTKGLWTQYTAIIQPDAAATSWESENLNQGTSTSSGAKSMSMLFGDFGDAEETTPDAIEEIIAEAEQNGQTVERMNIIVNINGQVVRQGTDVNGLPSGIYIVNGKKYLVR